MHNWYYVFLLKDIKSCLFKIITALFWYFFLFRSCFHVWFHKCIFYIYYFVCLMHSNQYCQQIKAVLTDQTENSVYPWCLMVLYVFNSQNLLIPFLFFFFSLFKSPKYLPQHSFWPSKNCSRVGWTASF